MDYREKIKAYVSENFNIEFDDEITEDSNLFQMGLIDSYGYLKILNFLESEFGFSLSDDDILSNVLSSLSSFYEFIEQKSK
jgi:acyl carrier protein